MIGSPLVIAEKARARLQRVLTSVRAGETAETSNSDATRLPSPADLIITACEVNSYHGTGTLLLRMFPDSSSVISLRTNNFYDGYQPFGAAQLCLPLAHASRTEISSWLRWYLGNVSIRRIMVLPYTPAEIVVALAAEEMLKAPVCTYIMDDKNVCADGISDDLMQELLEKSRLRLVISPEMRDGYQDKYHLRFWVVPPLVPSALMPTLPVHAPPDVDRRTGVLLGNMWGQRWLDMLRETLRNIGYRVDWYCNTKDPAGLSFDREEMAADGIRLLDPVPEGDLPRVLARYPFALVPSDTLDGRSLPALRALAQFSLPSRIVTMMATAHLPVLVVGDPATCAARFIARFDLGCIAPYEQKAVTAALDTLIEPRRQHDIRTRAAALSRHFSADGSGDAIWAALESGEMWTSIFEDLMPSTPPASAVSPAHREAT